MYIFLLFTGCHAKKEFLLKTIKSADVIPSAANKQSDYKSVWNLSVHHCFPKCCQQTPKYWKNLPVSVNSDICEECGSDCRLIQVSTAFWLTGCVRNNTRMGLEEIPAPFISMTPVCSHQLWKHLAIAAEARAQRGQSGKLQETQCHLCSRPMSCFHVGRLFKPALCSYVQHMTLPVGSNTTHTELFTSHTSSV